MLIKRENILELVKLTELKGFVPISAVPKVFKSDFDKFFFGKTMTKDSNNNIVAYSHDIKQWVSNMFKKY